MTGAQAQHRFWTILGWSFLAGAVFDLTFGVGALAAQDRLAALFDVVLPARGVRVQLDLNGLLLVGLGVMYLQIFRDPRRLAPVAAAATLLRFGGFALFYGDVMAGRAGRFYLGIGVAEAILGMVHLALLRLAAGSLVGALLGRERSG